MEHGSESIYCLSMQAPLGTFPVSKAGPVKMGHPDLWRCSKFPIEEVQKMFMSMVSSLEGTHVCLFPHFPHTVRKVCIGTMSSSKMRFKMHSTLLKLHVQHRQKIFPVALKQSNFRASYSVLSQETIRIQPRLRFPLSPLSTVRDPQETKEVRNQLFNPSSSWPLTCWLPNSSLSHPYCRNTSMSSSVQWRGLNKQLTSKHWCVD